ncbi:hypothetical protein PTI98_007409 [Pleurotus ostreatus]|nr:hypothetical protein PTI98_007409 [Pleurotus ostreatus]
MPLEPKTTFMPLTSDRLVQRHQSACFPQGTFYTMDDSYTGFNNRVARPAAMTCDDGGNHSVDVLFLPAEHDYCICHSILSPAFREDHTDINPRHLDRLLTLAAPLVTLHLHCTMKSERT